MDMWRYFFAVLLVISLPPALVSWYYIHPFVSFWRKLGPAASVTIMVLQIVIGMGILWNPLSRKVSKTLQNLLNF